MGRYDSRTKGINKEELYEDFFEERGVNHIKHYTTPKLRHPTAKERESLERIKYVWTSTSKFWRLAEQYYNSPELWWVIAQFNQTPTEAHVEVGQIIYIPLPLERILGYYKV